MPGKCLHQLFETVLWSFINERSNLIIWGQHGHIIEKKILKFLPFSSHCNFIYLKLWLKLRSVLHTDPFHSFESVNYSWRGKSANYL